MGGAHSTDRAWREPLVSWWPEEVPDEEERERAMEAARGGGIDFVVTHEAPRAVRDRMFPWLRNADDEYSEWLDGLDSALPNYLHWFFGHHHSDRDLDDYSCVYEGLYEIGAGRLEMPPRRFLNLLTMPLPEHEMGYTALELAQCAGIPEAAMDEVIDAALVGGQLNLREDGVRLVRSGDVKHIDRWLRENGVPEC